MTSPTSSSPPNQPPSDERKAREVTERFELLDHITRLLEPVMTVLGLVFLGLLLLEYAGGHLSIAGADRLDGTLTAIWVIFVVDFALRFFIAPAKRAFLRQNWLTVLSLALPFLRPLRALRALRAARAVRSLSLVRLLGGVNRAMRLLQRVAQGRQFAYVGGLTLFVVVAGAVGVRFFDRSVPGAPIQTFGDALWWSSAMVTTINNELYAVSPEARIIAILQRVYAVSVFGFITASIASYLIGSDAQKSSDTTEHVHDRETEIYEMLRLIQDDLTGLRHEVTAIRDAWDTVDRREVEGR